MSGTATRERPARTAADFDSGQEVRWCPGCGDYAVLKAVRQALAETGARPEDTVFVSGIGCASRLPYYIATYGFHTIHGRAPAVATGLKLANPGLDVWIVTGDGDGLSIGANHLMHLLRRNVDCQVLLFNNEAYGLTKGQHSPTSRVGTVSPSSPGGSIGRPVSAGAFALGSGATFLARAIDTRVADLAAVLAEARAHEGAAFVEIFQNCTVYNDGVFSDFTDRATADERQVRCAHGEPLLFGRGGTRGIVLDPAALSLRAADVGDGGIRPADVLVHDETNRALAGMLAAMEGPDLPVAIGVLYRAGGEPPYEREVRRQRAGGDAPLDALMRKGPTWRIP